MRIRLILVAWIVFASIVGISTNLEANTSEEIQFFIAITDGDIEGVKDAIRYDGVDVNVRREGFPALHFAAVQGHIAIARVLIEAGADVSARDDYGSTASQVADHKGHTELARILRIASGKTIEKGWLEGAKGTGSFQEGFKYGFEQSMRGNTPWYIWLFWFIIVGLFTLACYKGAERRNRNPWVWGGVTALCIPLPLICWVPYVVLRILGKKDEKDTQELGT